MPSRTKPVLCRALLYSLSALGVLGACDGTTPSSPADGEETLATISDPLPLAQVRFWAYQIQNLSDPGAVDALAGSHYDLLVVDPTRTDWSSTQTRDFDTPSVVSRLKATAASDGAHRKRVVAYIDIGEAEDWRWYWTWSLSWPAGQPRPADWPDYILIQDPDGWEGNYPVAYWEQDWKNIVIYGSQASSSAPYGNYVSLIDEALLSGFDGIYLDWVEGFENEAVALAAGADGVDPAEEMIRFISEMRTYARQRNPDFLIIQQNAAALIDGHRELLAQIDAIAQEEVWFAGDATDDWNDPSGYDFAIDSTLTSEYIGYLDQYLAGGLPVFNCEYALGRASEAYSLAAARNYIPYCTRRSLGQITTTPPPGY